MGIGTTYHFTIIYLSPSAPPDTRKALWQHLRTVLTTFPLRHIIMGDFNAKHQDWSDHGLNPAGTELAQLMRTHQSQHIVCTLSTHIHTNQPVASRVNH